MACVALGSTFRQCLKQKFKIDGFFMRNLQQINPSAQCVFDTG